MQISISLLSHWVFISNAIHEGEQSLNTTSTTSQLKFAYLPPIPPPLSLPLPPQFAAYHIQLPRNEPLPSLEGCGLKSKCLISFGNVDLSTPPLSRGMWVAQTRSMEETEDREELRREIHKGRPRKWEAHQVHPNNEPQLLSWFIFFLLSFLPSS